MLPLPKPPSQRELDCLKSHQTVDDYNLPHLHKIIPSVSTDAIRSPGIFLEELEKTNVRLICMCYKHAVTGYRIPLRCIYPISGDQGKQGEFQKTRTSLLKTAIIELQQKGAIKEVEELEDQYLIQPYLC